MMCEFGIIDVWDRREEINKEDMSLANCWGEMNNDSFSIFFHAHTYKHFLIIIGEVTCKFCKVN